MWLSTIIALAALQQASSLRVITPNNVDPSAISNIELLVPLQIPKESVQSAPKLLSKESKYDVSIDHDERYSVIPAFAFKLNESPYKSEQPQQSQRITSRSLFLALHPPEDDQSQSQKNPRYKGNNICKKLAQQQDGELREVVLNLCEELVKELSPKCKCYEQENVVLKKNWKLSSLVNQKENPESKEWNRDWWRLERTIDFPLSFWFETGNTRRDGNETLPQMEKTTFCGDCAYARFRGGLLADQRLALEAKADEAAIEKVLYGKETLYVHKMQTEVDAVLKLLQDKELQIPQYE